MFLLFGVVFGAIGALSSYLISYHEYRGRRLRPDQDPKRLALGTATTTFVFFVVASVVLAFLLNGAAA
ncbi:MAG: hypothetical protein ACRD1V_05590 [Vicinamibacterales bacterium]